METNKQDTGYTAKIARIVGSDIGDLLSSTLSFSKKTSIFLGKAAVKLSYPITGNLSMNVKLRLEDKLGTDYFNAGAATKTTLITNPLMYYFIGSQESAENLACVAGVTESIARVIYDGVNDDQSTNYYNSLCMGYRPKGYSLIEAKRRAESTILSGSILGKIMSFPIEYVLNIYDRVTNSWRVQEITDK